jgi:hypothetical protein
MRNKTKENTMTQTLKRILFSAIAVIVLLTACLPQGQATPDPVEIANQIATSVALTVSAAQAQTQAAEPIATNTTLPTQTESVPPTATPLIPTATPFVIVPPTATLVVSSSSGGGGGVTVKPDYDCTPILNKPRDKTVFHKNDTFDIKWTIVNTGTKTIPAKHDVKYLSGPDMAPGQSPFELPVGIKPGESFVIDLDGEAPDKLGFHVMTWVMEGNMCYPYIAIIVE